MGTRDRPINSNKKDGADTLILEKAASPEAMISEKRNTQYSDLLATVTGLESGQREDILTQIKKGLPYSSISPLQIALHVSQKEISRLLSISQSTLARRKNTGRLHPDESDRVVRFAHLKDEALALMNNDDTAAIAWLKTPLDILGGDNPLEHATTELGARNVEDLIGRLRHGVFS